MTCTRSRGAFVFVPAPPTENVEDELWCEASLPATLTAGDAEGNSNGGLLPASRHWYPLRGVESKDKSPLEPPPPGAGHGDAIHGVGVAERDCEFCGAEATEEECMFVRR